MRARFPENEDGSRESLLEPLELVDPGHAREENELVAARLLVAPHVVLDGPRARQLARGDLLREWAGERVVVAEVRVTAVGVAEREVPLAPELRPPRTAEVAPGGNRASRGVGERPRRPAVVRVAVRIPRHPRVRRAAQAADEDLDPVSRGADEIAADVAADVRQLLAEPLAATLLP